MQLIPLVPMSPIQVPFQHVTPHQKLIPHGEHAFSPVLRQTACCVRSFNVSENFTLLTSEAPVQTFLLIPTQGTKI